MEWWKFFKCWWNCFVCYSSDLESKWLYLNWMTYVVYYFYLKEAIVFNAGCIVELPKELLFKNTDTHVSSPMYWLRYYLDCVCVTIFNHLKTPPVGLMFTTEKPVVDTMFLLESMSWEDLKGFRAYQ